MSSIRRTVISSAALIGLLGAGFTLAATASAETQKFIGGGSSPYLAGQSALWTAEAAGYTQDQCTLGYFHKVDRNDFEATATCTR